MGIYTRPNIVTNGLVMYLDAGNYRSYTSGSANWFDLTGNQNSGSLANNPVYSTDGGGSLVFNGSNNYVSKSNWINPVTNILTIECWAKFSDNVNDRYLLAFGRDVGGAAGGSALFAYGFNVISDQLIFEFGSGVGRVSSGIVPSLNLWYHVVATADGTNTRFYLNGSLRNTSAQGSGAITSSPVLSIGSYVSSVGVPSAYFHSGNIARTSLYNRALTGQEVAQNYNATKTRFNLS